MKNLYLVETNAFNAVVLYDTEDKTVDILDIDADAPDFKLSDIDQHEYGVIGSYYGVEDIEGLLGIDYNDSETPRIIETIENWEG